MHGPLYRWTRASQRLPPILQAHGEPVRQANGRHAALDLGDVIGGALDLKGARFGIEQGEGRGADRRPAADPRCRD